MGKSFFVEDVSFSEFEKLKNGGLEWNRDELLEFVKKYGFATQEFGKKIEPPPSGNEILKSFVEDFDSAMNKYGNHSVILPTVEYIGEKVFKENRDDILQDITYDIVGMRTETYMGTVYYGHNCDFREVEEELPRDVICCTKGGKKYEIYLFVEHGVCGSGWCTSTEGKMQISEVDAFGEITHLPREKKSIELVMDTDGSFSCEAFSYDNMGEDPYYPSGSAEARKDFFIERGKIVEQTQDQTQDDFSDKSPEELQEMLAHTTSENEMKKAELEKIAMERKQELIRAIVEAQEESKRLDEVLNNLRNKKEI